MVHVEPWKGSYHRVADTFRHWFLLVLPCIFLAILTNYLQESVAFENGLQSTDERRVGETLTLFSMFLKPLTFVPQILFLSKNGEIDNFSEAYVLNTVIYRLIFTGYSVYQISIYSKLESTELLEQITGGVVETVVTVLLIRAIRKYSLHKLT